VSRGKSGGGIDPDKYFPVALTAMTAPGNDRPTDPVLLLNLFPERIPFSERDCHSGS